MEADEIARRIRQIHDIETAMDESGEGKSPLTDALRNAIPYMTPEEIRETLFRTLDKLDELYGDRSSYEEVLRKEREAHVLEVSNLREEMASKVAEKDRSLAEKDARISALEKELAESKAANIDANHKIGSMNQDKYQGTSKKGIDKKHQTQKGRDDDKGDFDGTPDSSSPQDSCDNRNAVEVETITRTKEDIEKDQKTSRGKYTLADATEKVIYECDDTLVPEGAVIVNHSKEVVIDEEHIIRAYIYMMVTYRIRVPFINEGGEEDWRVEEHTVHMRRVRRAKKSTDVMSKPSESAETAVANARQSAVDDKTGASETACRVQECAGDAKSEPTERSGCMKECDDIADDDEIVIYENGHMPGQITNTKVSERMLAHLILQHFDANVSVNRLSHIFDELGLDIDRSSVGCWLKKAASLMEKAYERLLDQILADGSVCYCDETWGRLHLKEVTKKVYTWIIGNRKAKAVAYYYDDGSRGRKVLVDLLKGRNIKAMHTDGYTAYYYLMELNIRHICCGSHVWRKIKDWYERTGDPEAKLLLLDLQWLFIQEAQLKETGAPPEEVLRRRNSTDTTEVITRFSARLEKLKLNIDRLPRIGRTAVNYALNMQAKVFRWREDADYELDNNWCERAARPYSLFRKTSMHHGSHSGAKIHAILRSFVETCKLEGISIVKYFTTFFKAVCSGRTDYENLLPATIKLPA